MKVQLSGTAGRHGWPEPGCPCASCARLPTGHRRPFRLLVDGRETPWGSSIGGLLVYSPGMRVPEPRYDLVLLDLLESPESLGLLRRRGVVDEGTQVVAVGLDHRIRSEEELGRRLGCWGAIAVPDGTALPVTASLPVPDGRALPVTASLPVPDGRALPVTAPLAAPPRRTLLLGGARSGKSAEAELRLAAEPYVTYVATGPSGADDADWAARVKLHRERRPAHWDTLETTGLAEAIREARTPLLVDGLGTWLAAVFDEHGAWEGDRAPVEERCDALAEAWRSARGRIVAVSDEVGLGVVPATASGRAFRDALGRLNERLAEESDDVALLVAGRLVRL